MEHSGSCGGLGNRHAYLVAISINEFQVVLGVTAGGQLDVLGSDLRKTLVLNVPVLCKEHLRLVKIRILAQFAADWHEKRVISRHIDVNPVYLEYRVVVRTLNDDLSIINLSVIHLEVVA